MALVFTSMGSLILYIPGKDKYGNGSSTATFVSFMRTAGKLDSQCYPKGYRDCQHHSELRNLSRMRELQAQTQDSSTLEPSAPLSSLMTTFSKQQGRQVKTFVFAGKTAGERGRKGPSNEPLVSMLS